MLMWVFTWTFFFISFNQSFAFRAFYSQRLFTKQHSVLEQFHTNHKQLPLLSKKKCNIWKKYNIENICVSCHMIGKVIKFQYFVTRSTNTDQGSTITAQDRISDWTLAESANTHSQILPSQAHFLCNWV